MKKEDLNNYPIKMGVSIPEWIRSFEECHVKDYELDVYEGIKYYLLDQQYYIDLDKIITFKRQKKQPTSMMGLEECSNFIIDFNPQYQSLNLHHIIVYRDEIKKLNKLDTADIHILKREYDAERRIFSGNVNLSIILDSIKINDIIEIAYSIIDNDATDVEYFNIVPIIEFSVPLQQFHLAINAANSRLLHYKLYSKYQNIESVNDNNKQLIFLARSNIPAKKIPRFAPPWYKLLDCLQICIDKSWQDIAKLQASYYHSTKLTDLKLQHFITQINEQKLNPEIISIRILEFIQKNIRYLSNYKATDAIQPSDPNETIRRAYGDCKDFAYLFINLLRIFNINAHPVLVSTNIGKSLDEYLPASNLFNHVIIIININDKEYYIDPTILQSVDSIDCLLIPDYGFGLRCDDVAPGLIKLSTNSIQDHVDVLEDYKSEYPDNKTVTFKTEVVLCGWPALRLIYFLQSNPEALFWENIDNFYKKTLSIEAVIRRAINFDKLPKNEISYSVEYKGDLTTYSKIGDGYNCEFVLREFFDYFIVDIPETLDYDYYYGKNISCNYKIQFHDPSVSFFNNKNVAIQDEAFTFRKSSTGEKGTITFDCRFDKKIEVIPKDRYQEFLKNHKLAIQEMYILLEIRKNKSKTINDIYVVTYFIILILLIILLNHLGIK